MCRVLFFFFFFHIIPPDTVVNEGFALEIASFQNKTLKNLHVLTSVNRSDVTAQQLFGKYLFVPQRLPLQVSLKLPTTQTVVVVSAFFTIKLALPDTTRSFLSFQKNQQQKVADMITPK